STYHLSRVVASDQALQASAAKADAQGVRVTPAKRGREAPLAGNRPANAFGPPLARLTSISLSSGPVGSTDGQPGLPAGAEPATRYNSRQQGSRLPRGPCHADSRLDPRGRRDRA